MKVKHKLIDVVANVLFAMITNADEWEEIEDFAYANEDFLHKYLELPNKIPLHDTIQRVMATIDTKVMQETRYYISSLDTNITQFANAVREHCQYCYLKLFDIGKKVSLKRKRYIICDNATKFLEQIVNM